MSYTDFFHVVAVLYPNVFCVSFHKRMQYVRTSKDLPPGLVDFVLFQGVFQVLINIDRIVVSLSLELAVYTYMYVFIYIYIYIYTYVRCILGEEK